MSAIFAVAVQIVLLVGLFLLSAPSSGSNIIYRWFNPAAFCIFFSTLFFVLPEIYGLAHDYYLDDFPAFNTSKTMGQWFINGEWLLAAFFSLVVLGVFVARPLSPKSPAPDATDALIRPLTARQKTVLAGFLAAGILANIYLSIEFRNSTGFRSLLVKSTGGKVFTSVVFFGGFAVAVLFADAVRARKYVRALAIPLCFAGSVTLTQSRGRILWPIAIAVILLMANQKKLKVGRLAVAASLTVVVLLMLDPFTQYLKSGQAIDVGTALNVDAFFGNRNFDGMSNFVLISQTNVVRPDPARWITGANDDFMNTFFPQILAQGVAFGVTVPGWFFMAGGIGGLCVGAIAFGAVLELLNGAIRRLRSPELLVGYLFAIVWIAAVGGDVVGSLDKAFVNFMAGVSFKALARERAPTDVATAGVGR